MYNKDYSKEVGLDSGERIVPWRYLIPLLALLAALCWLGARALVRQESGGHSAVGNRGALSSHS